MKRVRRVPRKIGGDEHGEEEDTPMPDLANDIDSPSVVVVKRPTAKKHSSLSRTIRTSFRRDYNEDDGDGDDDATGRESTVVKPLKKPSSIHRDALQRSSQRYRISTDRLPDRSSGDEERPSYSSSYLDQLRNSTPSGPVESHTQPSLALDDLDVASEFGNSASTANSASILIAPTSSTRIPTDAEIREKKERRRRLAQEANAEEYISLNNQSDASSQDEDDEDPRSRSLIIPADEVNIPSKYGESRLVHEDEDIAEGFDEFVEDAGRVSLSRSARKEQERERRRQIEKQIREASAGPGSDSDNDKGNNRDSDKKQDDADGYYYYYYNDNEEEDDDAQRRHAYDASQARAGMHTAGSRDIDGGSSSRRRRREQAGREAHQQRLMQPPRLRAIPELKVLAAQYTQAVKEKELAKARAEQRLEQLRAERREIEGEELRIKKLLREAGDKLEKLTTGDASTSRDPAALVADGQGPRNGTLGQPRGLESVASLNGTASASASAPAPALAPNASLSSMSRVPLQNAREEASRQVDDDGDDGDDDEDENDNVMNASLRNAIQTSKAEQEREDAQEEEEGEDDADLYSAFSHQRRGFAGTLGLSAAPAADDDGDDDDYY